MPAHCYLTKRRQEHKKIVTEPQFLKSHREPKRDKKENCKEKDNRETSKKKQKGPIKQERRPPFKQECKVLFAKG